MSNSTDQTRDRLGGQLAYPVHVQVAITCVALHGLTDYLSCASRSGLRKATIPLLTGFQVP